MQILKKHDQDFVNKLNLLFFFKYIFTTATILYDKR